MPKLQDQLIQRLVELGVEHVPYPGRTDGFCGLRYLGKEFAHFHDFNELDLRLTQKIIKAEGVSRPTHSRVHPDRSPNSQWIELPFRRASQLDEIVRLVKLAMEQLT